MSQFGVKIDKYDRTFTEYIMLRDRRRCQMCGRRKPRMETSHVFSRRHQGIRYDPRNAFAACNSCHRAYHSEPVESAEWLKSVRGEQEYYKLRLKANTPTKLTKYDKDMIRANLQERINEMKAGEFNERPFNSRFFDV